MHEKLTREKFWKLVILLGNSASGGRLKEDGETFNHVWKAVEANNQAIREEARAELLKDHFKVGERVQAWDKLGDKWVEAHIEVSGPEDRTSVFDAIRRPPSKRPMTREELQVQLAQGIFAGRFNEDQLRSALDYLGIPVEPKDAP